MDMNGDDWYHGVVGRSSKVIATQEATMFDNTKPAIQAMEQSNGKFLVYMNALAVAAISSHHTLGYRMFWYGTGRTNGRKHYPTPEACAKAYFGRKVVFNRIGDA
jgi:hypothetical protein